MTGLFNEELLSSHTVSDLIDHFAVHAVAMMMKLLRKGREIPTSGRKLVMLILISDRIDWGSCSGFMRMWHAGHRLDFFERIEVSVGASDRCGRGITSVWAMNDQSREEIVLADTRDVARDSV